MSPKSNQNIASTIDASPVKSFFVTMLTRDIRLEEAILDLLDNCVDGILRNETPSRKAVHPYAGFWAKINFSGEMFSIEDNCGGIPWSLHEYAFRMGRDPGRDDESPGTVGVYGIGMKRAIFKLGSNALISTQNSKDRYEVEISPEWIEQEEVWDLPVKEGRKLSHDGTMIVVGDLHKGISAKFSDDKVDFERALERMIATHYAFIIEKGFEVKINGKVVKPRATKLVFSNKISKKGVASIKPFIWETTTRDGVEVFLSVGFTRPIPTAEEVENEQIQTQYSSLEAGWTVLCNDRAVLYCDRTELTGWGEAGVPRYHTQFIAISGIVEFKCNDPSKLPTTTTKRGIDASSRLYLQVKNKMREGLRLFINHTNKWKDHVEESKEQIKSQPLLTFDEIKKQSSQLTMRSSKNSAGDGRQFMPTLPEPPKQREASTRRVTFSRPIDEIKIVSSYLFDSPDENPSTVGERCFEVTLKKAER